MSDSDASSSEGEDIAKTGLVASRAKRSTAGNRLQSLLANIDDDELQKELLAEDAEDIEDYNSDAAQDDGDEALESSSDDEDAGPLQEGDEDLSGEREMRKEERKEASQKRKAARPIVPTFKKRVKIAGASQAGDDGDTTGGAAQNAQPAAKRKKKSERQSWLPIPADMPTRQSTRALAVANRSEITHRLKDSEQRAKKQVELMERAARKKQAEESRHKLTHEERMEKARRIEKENARSLRGWEKAEEERERIRREKLAAMRGRGIEGPIVRWWSGGCVWEGHLMKVKRVGPKGLQAEKDRSKSAEVVKEAMVLDLSADSNVQEKQVEGAPMVTEFEPTKAPTPAAALGERTYTPENVRTQPPAPVFVQQPCSAQPPCQRDQAPTPVTWLAGIHEYAAQQPSPTQQASQQQRQPQPTTSTEPYAAPTHQSTSSPAPPAGPPSTHHAVAPAQEPLHTSNIMKQQALAAGIPWPPPPTSPVPVRELATRSLLILDQIPGLESTPRKSRSITGPTSVTTVLLPDAFPTNLTPAQQAYLTTAARRLTQRRDTVLPDAPGRLACALTSKRARYRDPSTGLAYADMHAYKGLQRIIAGGCRWSGLLGAWVGPSYGPLGRPAKGVPDGFAGSAAGG